MNIDKELDARGLNCPLPILRTRKAMADMANGAILKVTTTDPGAVKDMQAFCQQTGTQLLQSSQDGEAFQFLLKKSGGVQ